jgi:hypothetical protein
MERGIKSDNLKEKQIDRANRVKETGGREKK